MCVCVCERERDCELLCSNISVRILMMLCCVYAVCVSVWERQTCVCVCVCERERDCELLCCDISVHILMMLCCVWVTLSVCLCICVRETYRDKETGKMIYLNLQWSILSSFMCLHVWFIHTLILDGMFCTSLSGLKEGIAHHPRVRRRAFHTCLTVTVILDRMLHTSPSGRKGSFALLCHSHTWWIVLHIILRYKEGLFCTSFSDIKRALPITLIYERGFCTSPSDMKGGISHHPQTWEFCTWKGGLHITLRHGRGHAHHPQTLKGGLHITLGHERGHAHHSQTWKEELHITLGYEGGVLHVTLRHERGGGGGGCTSPSDKVVVFWHITVGHEWGFCTSPSYMKGGFAHHPETWRGVCTSPSDMKVVVLHITLGHEGGFCTSPSDILRHERGVLHSTSPLYWDKNDLHIHTTLSCKRALHTFISEPCISPSYVTECLHNILR